MKGLLLNCLERKEEAIELVKTGLKHNIRSQVCWHVFGLVHKSNGNYKEASKCYLQALKIDADNQNILRDLSWLQIQMRDTVGYLATRDKILVSRPSVRSSWIAYAIGLYLVENYSSALDVINKYQGAVTERSEPYEESELILFQVRCLEKQKKYKEIIDHFHTMEAVVKDKYFMKIKTAEVLTFLGKFDLAIEKWTALVHEQGENYRLHAGLQTAVLRLDPVASAKMFALQRLSLPSTDLDLTPEQRGRLLSFYESKGFKCRVLNMILLTLVIDEELIRRLDQHLKKSIQAAIPALFEDIETILRVKSLKDPESFLLSVLRLVDGYIRNLAIHGSFDEPAEVAAAKKESPSCILWAKFLRAHVLEMIGRLEEALGTIDECIAHTPTALDMYVKKAMILKKLGEIQLAASIVDYCRTLDLQDRFLNNKTTKYLLRANRIDDASTTIAMFTKHEGDPEYTLFELQCSWYELESGEANLRLKRYGLALKRFYAILNHFVDFVEDMFDFHQYCVRKSTLRMYLDVLYTLDQQYAHKFYQRAFQGAIQILLFLHENPEAVPAPENGSSASSSSSKPAATTEGISSSSSSSSSSAHKDKPSESGEDDVDSPKKVDDDPTGDKLLRKNFLQEANIWCSHLDNRLHDCDCRTVTYYVSVKIASHEMLTGVDALLRAADQFPREDPLLNYSLVDTYLKTRQYLSSETSITITADTREQLEDRSVKLLRGHETVEGFALNFVDEVKGLQSFPHWIGAVKILHRLFHADPALKHLLSAACEILNDPSLWTSSDLTWITLGEALEVSTCAPPRIFVVIYD